MIFLRFKILALRNPKWLLRPGRIYNIFRLVLFLLHNIDHLLISFSHKILLFYLRQDQSELLEVMLADESSESSSESSDATDDIDLLLLDSLGCLEEPRSLGPRINLEDIEDIDCEQMFRYTSVYISQIQFL